MQSEAITGVVLAGGRPRGWAALKGLQALNGRPLATRRGSISPAGR